MNTIERWMNALVTALRAALPADAAVRWRRDGEGRPLLEWKGCERAVEFRRVRGPRIAEVEGEVAKALLRLSSRTDQHANPSLVVVALSRFGVKLETAIRAFMLEYAPEQGWALVDESGKTILVLPDLDLDVTTASDAVARWTGSTEPRSRHLFTDLNRWMLKIMLLREAAGDGWHGPRERPSNPAALARIAGVSTAKAYAFARELDSAGYLARTPGGLKLVRRRSLLESWLEFERNSIVQAACVRPIVPPQASNTESDAIVGLPPSGEGDVALGGSWAARRLGLARAQLRQPPLLHVRIPLRNAIVDWDLKVCESRDATMILHRSPYIQSVFRGVCRIQGEVSLVDMWQVALDSVPHAARGEEQAEYIINRILELPEDK